MVEKKNKRQIKFRAWDIKNKKWLSTCNVVMSLSGDEFGWNFGYEPLRDMDKDEFILSQFTGLIDKNKREIYEGDILKWDNECTILIKWVEDRDVGFGYRVLTQNDKNICAFDIRFYRSEESAEIIGNKYENPDLLDITKK